MDDYDFIIKIILIGDPAVGKSAIANKLVNKDYYPDRYETTIGVDFHLKILEIEDIKFKIQIWDTAGQEKFRSITKSYYKGAQGILLVYDITDRSTFYHLDNWLKEIKESNNNNDFKIDVIVGNKSDKERYRSVEYIDGVNFAIKNNVSFLECSVKQTESLNIMIKEFIKKTYQRAKENNTLKKNNNKINLIEKDKKSKNCCY